MNEQKDTIASEEILQLVSFKIGNEEFGVDILKVQEINRMLTITKVPNAPDFVEGVVNLRGKIIPVVNLRKRLNMPTIENDAKTRIIVVEIQENTVGFIVDEVKEVLRIPKSITEPAPSMIAGIKTEYITAVGKLDDRLLILLDLEKILSAEEVEKLEAISE